MQRDPTGKCTFCGGVYYLQKLAVHESICSLRPRRLSVLKAVRIVIGMHPQASKDRALLVRLVWQVMDGYFTEPPSKRLTEPRLILRAARRIRREKRRNGRTAKTAPSQSSAGLQKENESRATPVIRNPPPRNP